MSPVRPTALVLVDDLPDLGQIRHRGIWHRKQPPACPANVVDDLLAQHGDINRRRRLLDGLDIERHVPGLYVVAVGLDLLAGEGAGQNVEFFVEDLPFEFARQPEARELVLQVTRAHTQDQSALRQHIHHGVALSRKERIAEGQDADRDAQADTRCPLAGGGEENGGIGDDTVFVEVMLRHPIGAVSEFLGQNHVLKRFFVVPGDGARTVGIMILDGKHRKFTGRNRHGNPLREIAKISLRSARRPGRWRRRCWRPAHRAFLFLCGRQSA